MDWLLQPYLRFFARRERRFPIIWIIPAIVLPIIGAMLAWFEYDEYKQTLEQEYRFLEAHARIADSDLAGLLRNIRQLLERIAEERPTISAEGLSAYESMLGERKSNVPEIRTLAVTDAAGRIEITLNPSLKAFDASKRDYFTAHRDQEQTPNFRITRPFKSSFGDYSVTFSVAMRDRQGRFMGVVVAGVNYKFFDGAMTRVKPQGGNSIVTIFNQSGDIIYRLPDAEKYVGVNIAGSEQFQDFSRSGRMARSVGIAHTDGVKRMYVHRAIGSTGLGVAVARPRDEVFAAWRVNLALRVLMFLFVSAVTLSLAALAQRRQREALAGKAFSDQLIATANVMLVGLDANGAVTIFNEAAELVSGYRRDEVVGGKWFELVVPRDRYPRNWEVFQRFYDEGRLPRTFETPIMTKAGEERVIAWQNSEIRLRGVLRTTISFGIDITERQQLELVRRNEELSRRLVFMQEEERRRLAVELHDRSSPNLCALKINLGVIAAALPAQRSATLGHLLQDTCALIEDTITSIRSISADYRPPLLDHAGLWPALKEYAQKFSYRTGIAVHAESTELEARLAPDVEINLYRLAQEALTNCAKHSQATTVRIGHARIGDVVKLDIADDGVGFDHEALLQGDLESGLGLMTMRRRAEFMGGTFNLETRLGAGTRIAVEIPALEILANQPSVAGTLQ